MGRIFEIPVNQGVPVQTTVTKTVNKAVITFFELDIRPNKPPVGRVHFAIGFDEINGADTIFTRVDGGRVELDTVEMTKILNTVVSGPSSFRGCIEDILLDYLQSINLVPKLKSRAAREAPPR